MSPIRDAKTNQILEDPITFQPITNPVQTPCCKEIFQDCQDPGLDGWLKSHSSCPKCRKNISKEQLILADKIEGILRVLNTPSKYVKAPCGHTFEKVFIEEFLDHQHHCPLDDALLWKEDLIPAEDECSPSIVIAPEVAENEASVEAESAEESILQEKAVAAEMPPEPEPTPPMRRRDAIGCTKLTIIWKWFCQRLGSPIQ